MFNSTTTMPTTNVMEVDYETVDKERVQIRLGSVRELRDQVMKAAHNGPSSSSV